ncbi:MAG: HNH endonuclease [Bacilli bacterium]|nr:HNH endonuclease [Bacilli bacterium]
MSKKLEELKKEMIQVYGTRCWITLNKVNRLTAHHIIPVRDKGETRWENIALLSNDSHIYLNYIERIAPCVAYDLNCLFYELNRTYAPPTVDYEEEVKRVLRRVNYNDR